MKTITRNKTENISISLPKDVKKMAMLYAKKQDITFSQTVKEALKSYLLKDEFKKLQKAFRPMAIKLGVKSDEDVERIFN